MKPSSMPTYSLSKRLMAGLLLCSHTLVSCSNLCRSKRRLGHLTPPNMVNQASLIPLPPLEEELTSQLQEKLSHQIYLPGSVHEQESGQDVEASSSLPLIQTVDMTQKRWPVDIHSMPDSNLASIEYTQPLDDQQRLVFSKSTHASSELPSLEMMRVHRTSNKQQIGLPPIDYQQTENLTRAHALQHSQQVAKHQRQYIEQEQVEKWVTNKNGQKIGFYQEAGVWKAIVHENLGSFGRRLILPVYMEGSSLPNSLQENQLHIQKAPDKSNYIYVGSLGLKGGMKRRESIISRLSGWIEGKSERASRSNTMEGPSEGIIDVWALQARKGDHNFLSKLLDVSHSNHTYAQWILGKMYQEGAGVSIDLKQAASFYQKAAEKGYTAAENSLGDMFRYGYGVQQDYAQAWIWYQRAAEKGYAVAENNLGDIYYYGYGVKPDYAQAWAWYHKAAEKGYLSAQYKLGRMYERGYGVEQKYKKAVIWYQKAAEKGHASAQYRLGRMYQKGSGVIQDNRQAFAWYQQAAKQGHTSAQNRLAELYFYGHGVGQDNIQAFTWYQKAAEQGHTEAQYNLAIMYQYGLGPQEDYEEAFAWYQKAADKGHADAQASLASMYRYGCGIKKDGEKSIFWYLKSATQGNAEAQYQLGNMYKQGYDVKKDLKEAFTWYQKAAEKGHTDAQYMLANMYSYGEGVEKDLEKASAWYRQVVGKDYTRAKYMLKAESQKKDRFKNSSPLSTLERF